MSTRASIAALVTMMTSAVLFGIGATAVLSIPELNAHAAFLLPAVILTSFILGPILGWVIAPTLRARWQRRFNRISDDDGDLNDGPDTWRSRGI